MTATLVREKLVTAEEFWELSGGQNDHLELVEGKVVVMPPPGPEHGELQMDLGFYLKLFAYERNGVVRVYGETGYILSRNPDCVRAPDVSVVLGCRLKDNPRPKRGFWEIVPDVVLEVISPNDRAADLNEKLADYRKAGVPLIWILYPTKREIHVYRANGTVEILDELATLDGGDVLPEFRLPLTKLLWE